MNRSPIFLAAYRETGSVTRAAEAAGIHRSIHYRRLQEDPAYKAAFDAAHEVAIAVLEDEAIRRAVEGVEEPIVYKGEFNYPLERDKKGRIQRSLVPVTIRKYSDSLLQFLLRGAKPEKYRERFSHDVNAKVTHRFDGTLEDLLTTYRALTADDSKP